MRNVLAWAIVLAASACGQMLDGVIDFHAHSDPDSVPRSIDAIDLAKLAKSKGLAALSAMRSVARSDTDFGTSSPSVTCRNETST